MRGGLLALATTVAVLAAAAAAAAGDWPVSKVRDNACLAPGPSADGTSISMAYIGPEPMLVISSPHLPAAGPAPIGLRFDDGAPLTAPGEGKDHTYGILLARPIAEQLRGARTLTLTLDGVPVVLPLGDAAAAMDGLAHCAGAPTFAQTMANAPVPIPGAGGWKLIRHDLPDNACMAMMTGENVDVMLMQTRSGGAVLAAGNNAWNASAGSVAATLQVDGDPPLTLKFSQFANMVLAPADDVLLARLRRATVVIWHLPSGDYRASVTGLGMALDALAACHGS